ncbi:MAG: sigma-70 family RNA polymerase sigma factor [Selenomonadaceae bacterium]|nr:sigma-70 family RNA polymerase sigma factor [Selenomonadaceae bacterium]
MTAVARRFCGRGCDLEDLIQIGMIGMLKAIRSFDISRGNAFSTYAVPMIMGEIKKFLRDDGACALQSAASAAITGNMLTTVSNNVADDMRLLRELGLTNH